jgi:hypothetical protein
MTPAELMTAWRAEILAEAEELEKEIAATRREFDEADRAYRVETARWDEIRITAARGLNRVWETITEGMSGVLYDRVEFGRDESLLPLSRARGAANARLRSLESQIAGRRLAIRQIDAALAPRARATAETVPKPKRAAVEFDTIREEVT